MTEVALKKILDTMLKKEFPDITKIMVIPSDEASRFHPKVYFVYIGIEPIGLAKNRNQQIKESAEMYSKFVINPKEMVSIRFVNPN